MNIEELLALIKPRPSMFIGELNLEFLQQYINGFLFNNVITKSCDEIDQRFKEDFHAWVKKKLEEERNKELPTSRNYVYYINAVEQNEKEKVELFFNLASEFFEELDTK